jgi:hypothetical protein
MSNSKIATVNGYEIICSENYAGGGKMRVRYEVMRGAVMVKSFATRQAAEIHAESLDKVSTYTTDGINRILLTAAEAAAHPRSADFA